MKQDIIIDPITGEKLTKDSGSGEIFAAIKRIKLKIKELEPIVETLTEWVQPIIDKNYGELAPGELLHGFTLSVSAGRFNENLFLTKAEKEII